MTLSSKAISFMLFAGLALFGAMGSSQAQGGMDGDVNETLARLFRHVPGTQGLAARAAGVLVFPTVVKAGIGIGGEYGEGELRVGGRTAGYYNTASASIGFQLGAEARSVVIMFMTPHSFNEFRRMDGFKVGVDGSIAIITVGAGGSVDTENITSPVIGFIIDPKGLMYNLTLEGSKISRMR